jgi:hypothetical protein
MGTPRFLSNPVGWLPLAYLAVFVIALLVVLAFSMLVPSKSKFLAAWLLLLSLPWSDLVLSRLAPGPLALWCGVLAGFALNSVILWCASLAVRWVIRALASLGRAHP